MKKNLFIFFTLIGSTILTQATIEQGSKTIVNGIKKKDIGVNKFGMRYPSEFSCYVNGKKIEPGEQITLPADKKKAVITYAYEWQTPWGKKTGKKKALFGLGDGTQKHTIGFKGWKTDNRIQLSGADKLTGEEAF